MFHEGFIHDIFYSGPKCLINYIYLPFNLFVHELAKWGQREGVKEHFWQREALNMSHLIEVIRAQNPRIYKGLCGGRFICISIGYLSLIIFLLMVFILPLPYGWVLRHFLCRLGNGWHGSLQSWDSWAQISHGVLWAPCHARSELLGRGAHRDLNFFFPVFWLTSLL